MRTLLGERFAPITSSPGYLRLPFDDAVRALIEWRERLRPGGVGWRELDTGFPECLHTLEPLVAGARPREVLVEMTGGWTAYFDCLLHGTDAVSAVGYLSRTALCQGVALRSVPSAVGLPGVERGRWGAVQFELYGPLRTQFLNYVRTISLINDVTGWEFDMSGTQQWFEEPDSYKARRVRDRFSSQMLERYCAALGLAVFDPTAYGPRAVLVETDVVMPARPLIMNLEDAQHRLGIVAGGAENLSDPI